MKLRLLLCIALVAGCADMKENMRARECASDWYAVGENEGAIGTVFQGERHAAHCPATFDAARYKEGFQKGFARRAKPTA